RVERREIGEARTILAARQQRRGIGRVIGDRELPLARLRRLQRDDGVLHVLQRGQYRRLVCREGPVRRRPVGPDLRVEATGVEDRLADPGEQSAGDRVEQPADTAGVGVYTAADVE